MKRNITIMYIISFFQGMVFYAAISTLYRTQYGLSLFDITLIESISLVLSCALEVPWGILSDHIGYKRSMIIVTFLFFISKIFFYYATSFTGFLLERILLGIVISGLSGLDTTILYHASHNDQKVYSIYNTLGTLGVIFASITYSLVIKEHYQLAALYTMISYGIAFIASLFLKEIPYEKVDKKEKNLYFDPKLLLMIIGVGMYSGSIQLLVNFFNQVKYMECGITTSSIAIIYIIYSLSTSLGVFSKQLTNRLKEKRTIIYLLGLSSILCMMISMISKAIIVVMMVILLGIISTLIMPLFTTIENRMITSKSRATMLSIDALIIEGISVFVELGYGKMGDININFPFRISGILFLISMILILKNSKLQD